MRWTKGIMCEAQSSKLRCFRQESKEKGQKVCLPIILTESRCEMQVGPISARPCFMMIGAEIGDRILNGFHKA